MTVPGLEVFDRSLHQTNVWLKDMMKELDWDDRHRAFLALKATLQALRDRLTVDEAAHLGAQLPTLLRGVYYEGWHPAGKPLKERRKEEFLGHVRDAFRREPDFDAERAVRSVFRQLAAHVSDGEISDVKAMLPKEIRALWPH